jgi:hypothetical protein
MCSTLRGYVYPNCDPYTYSDPDAHTDSDTYSHSDTDTDHDPHDYPDVYTNAGVGCDLCGGAAYLRDN